MSTATAPITARTVTALLKAHGLNVTSRTITSGAVKVTVKGYPGVAAEEAAARSAASVLIAAGYDAARTGATVTVTDAEGDERLAAVHAAEDTRDAAELAPLTGRVWPSREAGGFIAAPFHSCPLCPSVGATLCNFAGESLVFDTRDEALDALDHHAEHGCADVSDADAPTALIAPVVRADGIVLIDPRTPLAAEHEADAVREATLLAAEAAQNTLTDEQRGELVATVIDTYRRSAADCRQDDLAAFVTEAHAEPETIADEVLMTAVDLKIVVADWQDVPDPDGLVSALGRAAFTFAREVTVAELDGALVASYSHLAHGSRVRHTNGDLGTVLGGVYTDRDGLWVTVAWDGDETERRHPSTVELVETVTDTEHECSWCGQKITVTRDGRGMTTECGGRGEGSCDGLAACDPTATRCHEAAIASTRP